MTNFDSNVFDLITSLIDFVNICYKITFTFKGKQRFSIILLGHQKQIWKRAGGGGGGGGVRCTGTLTSFRVKWHTVLKSE